MKFYNLSIKDTFRAVHSTINGLTTDEAKRRLHRDGLNEVKVDGIPLWQRIIQPFANVMVLVLIVAAVISLFQHSYVDAIIIIAIILASAIIDWVQQYSTDRILRKLRKREENKVEVLRDGNTIMIPSEELVVGDVIILHEGQKVPADARVLESANLHADESMLTGESLSIHKSTKAIKGDKEVYDQANMVFSGSFIVAGSGQALITSIGNNTEFGKLAELTGNTSVESPIQQKIDKLVKQVIAIVAILAVLVLILELVRGVSFIDSLQFVLAFAVSAVPESLPIAITVVLAMGMRRMASRKALVRNMRAIENIGLTTVIATDKTGTLTENRLHIQDIWSPKFNENAFALQTSFTLNDANKKSADPLDQALLEYLLEKGIADPTRATSAELIRSLPFDYLLATSGNVWKFGQKYQVYIKGAPEKIIARCNITTNVIKQAQSVLSEYTSRGYRVIAYAKLELDTDKIKSLGNLPSKGLEFIGFTAVADQLRPRIDQAVRAAHRAGVKVCMITGDHPETALNIAQSIGIASSDGQVYDSHKLSKLTPEKLAQAVSVARVYARVTPQTKHKLLNELNKQEITAMTGDGVNDVPALTQAHVGIAMGSGSAIAKDASDIVLLDDNFRSIVTAIKEGRTIISNVRRMMIYLLATNAGEVLVTLGALLIGMPIPLVAVQILWINLATDTFMVIPLGIEPPRGNVMRRKPENPDAPILNKYMIGQMIIAAVSITVITLTTFSFFYKNYGLDYGRSAAFIVLIIIQWVNALVMRSDEPLTKILRVRNKAFDLALVGTAIVQLIVLLVPLFRNALHVSVIHSDIVTACVLAVVVTIVIMELYKYWMNKRQRTKK